MKNPFTEPKSRYPVQPEKFKMRVDRIETYSRKGHFRILPAITALECELLLHAYYGGTRRMIIAITKKAIWLEWQRFKSSSLYWFSDRMGWTKIIDVPETKDYIAHQRRHGKNCHCSPNCEGGCIERDQPQWFVKLINKVCGV